MGWLITRESDLMQFDPNKYVMRGLNYRLQDYNTIPRRNYVHLFDVGVQEIDVRNVRYWRG